MTAFGSQWNKNYWSTISSILRQIDPNTVDVKQNANPQKYKDKKTGIIHTVNILFLFLFHSQRQQKFTI